MKYHGFVSAVSALVLCAGAETAYSQTVSVWLTTDDQSRLLQPQAPLAFSVGTSKTNCVFVDTTVVYQQIEGFGASFTDTTGYTLNQLAKPIARTNALWNLFSRQGSGIGLSFMRIPMGGSDLARFHYSYDDMPAGQTDPNLYNFSIAHDEADIIPLIKQAQTLNPELKFMANPWSPPGWMKTSGSMIGGSLAPASYGPFAKYFVRFIQEYQRHGIPIHYISLQNEPLYVPGDYPGMGMDPSTQALLLRDYVLPALSSNQLSTKILIYDHNWSEPEYPDGVLADATVRNSSQVAGIAWHGYGGTPGTMLEFADKFPQKGNYQTEHSGGGWVGDQVRTDFHEIIHVMRSWGKAFVKWNLAGDQNDGPHAGGCATCTPLAIVNSNTGFITYSIDFYTLGHFSKFVLPGAWRVYSANAPGILTAAFLNPDLSKVLVAYNDTGESNTFQVQWGDRQFTYTLPAYSGVTFRWVGDSGMPSYRTTAKDTIVASTFHDSNGLRTEGCTDAQGGYDLGFAENGDWAVYRNVDFGVGISGVSARVASGGSGGTLEFRTGGPAGPLVGSLTIPFTGGWQTWQTTSGPASGSGGTKDLYLVFKGGSGIGNINWFQFAPAPTPLPQPWVANDIGKVGLAGSAGVLNGAFSIKGSGADIWSTADAFQFVHQTIAGDCDIHSRVASVQNTHSWAKAGVMMRVNPSSDAVNAAVLVTPGNGITFQIRTATGGTSTSVTTPGVTPRWVRLKREGTTISAYHSGDGVAWTKIGTSLAIALPSTVEAGMAVTSHDNTVLCTAVFDNVALTGPLAGITQPSLTNGAFGFLLNRDSSAIVQVSSDLVHWTSIATSAPSMSPQWWWDTNKVLPPSKFYRTLSNP